MLGTKLEKLKTSRACKSIGWIPSITCHIKHDSFHDSLSREGASKRTRLHSLISYFASSAGARPPAPPCFDYHLSPIIRAGFEQNKSKEK
jgi:hypothetical protein